MFLYNQKFKIYINAISIYYYVITNKIIYNINEFV